MFHRSRAVAPSIAFAVLALAASVLQAAETRPQSDSAREVADDDARRIVSIGGDVTEILYAIGVDDQIVGRDTTSTYPPNALDKPQVGYLRALSAEGVLSLAPDLIIAVEGSGPPDVLEVLERASVPFVLVPAATDGEGAVAKIRLIGEIVGEPDKAETVAKALEADLAAVAAFRESGEISRKAVFVLGMSTGAPVAAGDGTTADGIFALAGVENALVGFSGFKPTSDEAMLAARPDAVVVLSEGNHQLSPDIVFSAPAFAATPAAKNEHLVALPGGYLLNFGPRTAHAARDLAAAIYPERPIPKLPPRPWAVSHGDSAR